MRQSFAWPVAYEARKRFIRWPHEIWSGLSEITPEVCLCWDWRPLHDINCGIESTAGIMQEHMLNASEHEGDEREYYLAQAFDEMANINVLYHERSLSVYMRGGHVRNLYKLLFTSHTTKLWRFLGGHLELKKTIAKLAVDYTECSEPTWPEMKNTDEDKQRRLRWHRFTFGET
jgi:hypothetical protein